MGQPFPQLVVASNNAKKIRELTAALSPLGIQLLTQKNAGVEGEAAETGLTFVENAILKARYAAERSGLPAIADDSGIEVDSLKGAPGIYSARFSGEGATDEKNNALLIEKLRDIPEQNRTARYRAVIVFLRHAEDPTPIIAEGSWEGRIVFDPKGSNGFGYDPHFFVLGENCTAAELSADRKQTLSHRGVAIGHFLAQFRRRYTPEG